LLKYSTQLLDFEDPTKFGRNSNFYRFGMYLPTICPSVLSITTSAARPAGGKPASPKTAIRGVGRGCGGSGLEKSLQRPGQGAGDGGGAH
jgi:hypothetical protein